MEVHQQHHGYLRGHQLLASSVKLERADQEVIDRLSDIAGPVQSGSDLPPYLTGYPLPSKRYFVLARTWYDREAHRAGCVLTHSLLIPYEMWASMEKPSTIGRLHGLFPHADKSGLSALSYEPGNAEYLPTQHFEASAELTEALLLEEAEPVLWIADNPESSVLRIIDALWPSVRAEFAFQTYALKQRSINDRPFNLVAVPKSARGRFADWPGRRVEGRGAPRHAWTSQLSAEVFESEHPNLARIDPLGILQSEKGGDTSTLRLSLLWNDLNDAAVPSPNIVLGMLDILSASPVPKARLENLLVPVVQRALTDGHWMEFSSGAGRFLTLLLGKLVNLPPFPSLEAPLCAAFERLFLDHAEEGSVLFEIGNGSATRFNALLDQAFITAANQQFSPAMLRLMLDLDRARLGRLIDREPKLAVHSLISADAPEQAASTIARLFSVLSRAAQSELRAVLPARLTAETQVLVPILVDGIDDAQFASIARDFLTVPTAARSAIHALLLEAGMSACRRTILRREITSSSLEDDYQAELLASLFKPSGEEIEWLAVTANSRLAIAILNQARWSRSMLSPIVRNRADLLQPLISLLIGAGQGATASGLVRDCKLPFDIKLQVATLVLRSIPAREAKSLVEDLVLSAFPIRTKHDVSLARRALALEGAGQVISDLSPSELADLFLPRAERSAGTVRLALDFMNSMKGDVAKALFKSSDRIAEELVRDRGAGFDEAVYASWGQFLEGASKHEYKAAAAAAVKSLRFALDHERLPASDLVKSSFEIVYPMVKQDRRPVYQGLFSSNLDRPTKLRRSLADAYFRSHWPPRDLAIIGERMGIADDLFDYLDKKWGGASYLRRIFNDLSPRRAVEEKQARKRLRAYT